MTNQVTISLNQIYALGALEDEGEWNMLLSAHGGDNADMDKQFPLSAIIDSNGIGDALWCLKAIDDKDNLWRMYAIWCAKKVEHLLFDRRSHKAIEIAELYTQGKAPSDWLIDAYENAKFPAFFADDSMPRHVAYAASSTAKLNAAEAASDAAWYSSYAVKDDKRLEQTEKLRAILDAGEWVD